MPNPLDHETRITYGTALQNAGQITNNSSLPSRNVGPQVQKSIAGAYQMYRGKCKCGEDLGNNCAHFLSDAFIRAGYSELDGGTGKPKIREVNGRAVCRGGRPVRAREMKEWFKGMATSSHDGEPSDDKYWAVFQLDTGEGRYWGGHVVIHKHDGTNYDTKGTGDYPNWTHQEHYTW